MDVNKYDNYITLLARAILAGILVGMAGTIYLSMKDPILGSFSFAFGLLTIAAYGYSLYTGKIGYIIDHPPHFLIDILIIILGNFLGIFLLVQLLLYSGFNHLGEQALNILETKLSHTYTESFARSILCGILMYVAVDGYKKHSNDVAKVVIVFFAVVIFITAKFEHSIANMFYLTLTGTWSFSASVYILIMLAGNGVGAVLINFLEKLPLKPNKTPS